MYDYLPLRRTFCKNSFKDDAKAIYKISSNIYCKKIDIRERSANGTNLEKASSELVAGTLERI